MQIKHYNSQVTICELIQHYQFALEIYQNNLNWLIKKKIILKKEKSQPNKYKYVNQ